MDQSVKDAGAAFSDALNDALKRGEAANIPDEVLQNAMTAVVKAYAAKVEKTEQEFTPIDNRLVNATEAVVTACALIRAVDLNMFDVALWFNRPTHNR
ncbi:MULTISPECIES: hypothetical protein [unclassified Beijerinckia]|uniref:hypothetical protein n=1 Tax=unclassified Beijerinckia TaxID=2638183 RepID=UPI000898DC79|nr:MULTISPECIES: hypothetical protein [unclassified Beijerinckia]MDH7795558.1 vesicle coat complex subunit [Beijerinckia sp. GAS462]SEC06561.1 hypothetical protein SAMN05443249_1835 [Beijerinckia sp. 28-YEA-48]